MTSGSEERFHELSFYTLAHGHPRFLHQHAVDAFTAQAANEDTKTIAIVFALVGLCLFLEKNFTGRQVQRAHMRLAHMRVLPARPQLPEDRGALTIEHVLDAAPGDTRDQAIAEWCASVWLAYAASHAAIRTFLRAELDVR